MQRITITIDDDLMHAVDALMSRRGYTNRSEAFRDILRQMMDRQSLDDPEATCIATLSYVFDHETRELASRLTRAHHDRPDISVASMHVHLDHEACLEVCVMRGPSSAVTAHADTLATQRGVRHAHLHVIPMKVSAPLHAHDDHAKQHGHLHA